MAMIYAARTGLANRVNVMMEMLCRGDGGVLRWACNEHCSLEFREIFGNSLAEKLKVEDGGAWPDGHIGHKGLAVLDPAWAPGVVRKAAETVMEHFIPGVEIPTCQMAVQGRFLQTGGLLPGDYLEDLERMLSGRSGSWFVLTDSERERVVQAVRKAMGESMIPALGTSMTHDLDRADTKKQLAFCRDLKTFWMAEHAMTNHALSTMVDMRAYLGKPSWIPWKAPWVSWATSSGLQIPYQTMPGQIKSKQWEAAEEPVVFYHVANIGHWKEIVAEQLSVLKRAGFPGKIHIGFIGKQFEDGFIAHVADALGLNYEIRHFGEDLHQYEFPTLAWSHEFCQSSGERPVLYFHGKGVTQTSWQYTMWRWFMNAYNLNQWKKMVAALREHNCAGVSYDWNAFPVGYFPGNFWWARSSFIKQLTEVVEYVRQFEECISNHNPRQFQKRHAAECWFNSRMNADPFIAGPAESRFWDHAWWTSQENREWCDMAYLLGH